MQAQSAAARSCGGHSEAAAARSGGGRSGTTATRRRRAQRTARLRWMCKQIAKHRPGPPPGLEGQRQLQGPLPPPGLEDYGREEKQKKEKNNQPQSEQEDKTEIFINKCIDVGEGDTLHRDTSNTGEKEVADMRIGTDEEATVDKYIDTGEGGVIDKNIDTGERDSFNEKYTDTGEGTTVDKYIGMGEGATFTGRYSGTVEGSRQQDKDEVQMKEGSEADHQPRRERPKKRTKEKRSREHEDDALNPMDVVYDELERLGGEATARQLAEAATRCGVNLLETKEAAEAWVTLGIMKLDGTKLKLLVDNG